KKIKAKNNDGVSTVDVEKVENDRHEQKSFSNQSNLNNSSSSHNNLPKNLKIIQENIEARLKTYVSLNKFSTSLKKLVSISKLMEAGVYIGLPSFL
ncbi:hypothetical protein II654_01880, partial [bacterium]|nr:hypothetical protein [bacterium]